MPNAKPSSHFTPSLPEDAPLGPPLIGALLRMPVDTVRQRMLQALHEHGFTDLDPSHAAVFQYPGPQSMRPSELAGQLGITKQALNYRLGELERLGYLERRPDPNDLRSKRVVLTERGMTAGLVMREAVREVEAEWTELLGPERFAELRDILGDLNRAL